MKKAILKLSRFGLVGLLNTALSISIFYVAFEIYSFPLYLTYIVVYVLLTALSYYLNASFTFNSKRNKQDFIKYTVIYSLGLVVGLVCLWLLQYFLGFKPFYLVLLVIPLRVLITYIIINKVIYKA